MLYKEIIYNMYNDLKQMVKKKASFKKKEIAQTPIDYLIQQAVSRPLVS